MTTDKIIKGAKFSEDGKYRYGLHRIWNNSKPKVLFILLNPSTADSLENDKTIGKCVKYAKDWGYGGIYVSNIFAYKSVNSSDLLNVENPYGEDNDYYRLEMADKSSLIVCAWGNSDIIKKLKPNLDFSSIKKPLHVLDLSKDGTPKQPLYLKSNLKPQFYKA